MLAVADNAHERRCLVTGESGDPGRLVRFVVGPDDQVVADVAGDLPGRGFWLTATRAAVDKAVAKRAFARAARRPVDVPADLADQIDRLLARRCLDLLGFARRASQVVAGFEKVREWLEAGRVAVLVEARDGAADGRAKLARLGRGLPAVALFTSAELSLALGRENVVHAAVAPGRLAERFLAETVRLRGFRPAGSDHSEQV